MLTRLRQWLCQHEFDIADLKRRPDERIECACARCGAVRDAPCGLDLPGKLIQAPYTRLPYPYKRPA